ncbi:hypothetical protein [Mobiluncus mulieris]|uniref:hypothetical protein n=1 Tax=Mobiluncus mulieris TaxID=2052 RepID=UPI00031DECA1|nr:hypothetical protein [Mobiluncus mulieris]
MTNDLGAGVLPETSPTAGFDWDTAKNSKSFFVLGGTVLAALIGKFEIGHRKMKFVVSYGFLSGK